MLSCFSRSDSLKPRDRSLPGSFVHGILQARILDWVGCPTLLQEIFPTQGANLHLLWLLHWQAGSLSLVPCEKPKVYLFYWEIWPSTNLILLSIKYKFFKGYLLSFSTSLYLEKITIFLTGDDPAYHQVTTDFIVQISKNRKSHRPFLWLTTM